MNFKKALEKIDNVVKTSRNEINEIINQVDKKRDIEALKEILVKNFLDECDIVQMTIKRYLNKKDSPSLDIIKFLKDQFSKLTDTKKQEGKK